MTVSRKGNKKSCDFWLPLRILDSSSSTGGTALCVPSFTCLCFRKTGFSDKIKPVIRGWKISKGMIKVANERWESFMSVLTLIAPVRVFLKNEKDSNALSKLAYWFLNSLRNSGFLWTEKRMKTMYEWARHLSGDPLPESSIPDIPSGTPGFDRNGKFIGFHFFRNSSWEILNGISPDEGWKREANWAFSLGKRAMGFPLFESKIQSVLKFRKRTMELKEPPDIVHQQARNFAKDYVKSFPKERIRKNLDIHISDSSSATLEYSRSKKGRIRYGSEAMREFRETKYIFPKSREEIEDVVFYSSSGQEFKITSEALLYCEEKVGWEDYCLLGGDAIFIVLGRNRLMIDHSFAKCSEDEEISFYIEGDPLPTFYGDSPIRFFEEPPSFITDGLNSLEIRVDAVDDDGAKARIIGVSKGCLINLGHILRRIYTAILECDRQIPTMGWKGKGPERVLGPDPPFDSTDLTAATDNTPILEAKSLSDGLIDGLLESEILPDWIQRCIRPISDLLLRNSKVLPPKWFPKKLKLPGVEEEIRMKDLFPFFTKRSVQMGQPHSWCLLCLYNHFHRARSLSKDLTSDHLVVERPRFFRQIICGDDSGASGGTVESYLRFRESLIGSGYEISNGTDIISNTSLQYTEKLYIVESGEDRRRLREVKYPFPKSLVSKTPPTRGPQRTKQNQKTTFTARGKSSTSAIRGISLPYSEPEYAKKVEKAALIYCLYSNQELIQKAKELDIPPYLPQEFGGLGFTHPTKKGLRHTRPFFLKGISSLLQENRNLDYILSFRSLGSVWTYNPGDAVAAETKRLFDSWVSSVFSMDRKATCIEHLLPLSTRDIPIWGEVSWVDMVQISKVLDLPLEMNNWDHYDQIKVRLFEITKFKWFPFKEVMDHVESHFRSSVLSYAEITNSFEEVPKLSKISREIHKFYKGQMNKIPPRNSDEYRDKTMTEILDILHWRQNLVLVSSRVTYLENFRSRW